MSTVIGIDVATAEVRALAADPDGRVLARAARALPPPARPRPGWSQQRADYADAAAHALRQVTRSLRGRPVAAVSVTATSGTVVPCDRDGVAIGAALLYDDSRNRDGALRAAPALARIAWLARHHPAARYLHAADVVSAHLAGVPLATDTSHALKTGADAERIGWRSDLLAAAGIEPDVLPALTQPGVVIGAVGRAASASTGLPAGTPIVAGMTDGCTAQVAAGAVTPGAAVGVVGTTLVLKSVSTTDVSGLDGSLYSHRAPGGMWWPGGASNVGAGALVAAFPSADLASLDDAAAAHGPAAAVCYPLRGRGERFPFADPDAEPFWLGTPDTPVERYRALLEGVAFTERLGLDVLAAHDVPVRRPLRAAGGGSRSAVWLAVRATVTGRPLQVPAQPTSGFGAAVLAAATIHNGLAESVRAMVRTSRTVDPVSDEHAALDDSYHRLVAALVDRGHLAAEPAVPPNGAPHVDFRSRPTPP